MKVLHSYLIITAFPRPSYRLIFLIPPLSSFVLPELCDIAIASHLNRYFIALTYHFSLLIFLSPDFDIAKHLPSLGSPYLSPSFPFYCQFVWFSYSSFIIRAFPEANEFETTASYKLASEQSTQQFPQLLTQSTEKSKDSSWGWQIIHLEWAKDQKK